MDILCPFYHDLNLNILVVEIGQNVDSGVLCPHHEDVVHIPHVESGWGRDGCEGLVLGTFHVAALSLTTERYEPMVAPFILLVKPVIILKISTPNT